MPSALPLLSEPALTTDPVGTIVLLNSLGATVRMWDAAAERLRTRLHVLRLETRGHGEAGGLPEHVTIDDLVGDQRAALDPRGVARAPVAGVS
ncbi:hypothetical protein ABZZ80_46950, partial [Streptomyces sp. NPDC006356]